jgi:hypothetical protein
MLVFIDDSGDAGFKLGKGSTDYFVIAMVCFTENLEAEKVAVAIKELRRDIEFSENMEFRFFKTSKEYRVKFLHTISKFNFYVRCLVVDKKKIYSPKLRTDKNSFYSYFIKEALKNSDGSILDAKIKIDGSGDRVFRKSFLSYLRRELNGNNVKIMKQCKLVDSQSDVLIQMADMIAGSINRSYNLTKSDRSIYKSIFKKHIIDEWKFQ